MTIPKLRTFEESEIGRDILRRRTSLWILPLTSASTLNFLATLHWENVWNFEGSVDFASMLRGSQPSREPLVVTDASADPETFRASAYVRVYQMVNADRAQFSKSLQRIKIEQLKLRISQVGGTIFVVGDVLKNWEDVELIGEIAPQLNVCLVPEPEDLLSLDQSRERVFLWSAGIGELRRQYAMDIGQGAINNLLDLKDARGVAIPSTTLEELTPNWTLLTRDKITHDSVSQSLFDEFLNGKAEWQVYAAGGAYLRPLLAPRKEGGEGQRAKARFPDELLRIVRKLDQAEIDPRDSLRQIIIFSEPGSGTTTFLRQLAVSTAQAGYPVLISNPLPRNLTPHILGRVVGEIQDLWWQHRRGPGSGTGRLPVVIFIDKDAEDVVDGKSIAKALGSIGREVVLVRAVERSRDDMKDAPGAYLMPSEIDEDELLALGAHLRAFAICFWSGEIDGFGLSFLDGRSRSN